MTERLEDTELWKTIQRHKELDRKEEEQKRQEIIERENKDPFRKIDPQARYWIQRYLGLSGVMRNSYNQLVDKCKRLSMMQISHILKEVHNYDVSPEMVGKFKQFLIKEGLLKTDEEFEEERPSQIELRQIRKEGARSQAIERSKEKTHLEPEELNQILEEKKDSEDVHSKMRELRRRIEENGYCANESELRELEEYEENQEP